MNPELDLIANIIISAQHPEDVFGLVPSGADPQKHVKHFFALLARKVHPDFNSDKTEKKIAETAFSKLTELHRLAKDKLTAGTYGDKKAATQNQPPLEVTIKGAYVRYADFASGDIADLHQAYLLKATTRSEVLLKVARDSADNELLEAERDALSEIREHIADKSRYGDWNRCVPTVRDSFLLLDGAAKPTRMNVLDKFDGFLTVEQIHERLPKGVDGRTIAWMWKRLLGILDWTHQAGFIHGAVLPSHVMYFPDSDPIPGRDVRQHSVRLVDWCYSRKLCNRTKLVAWCPNWKDLYPPEVKTKREIGPWTDLFLGAQTMLCLCGDVEKEVRTAIELCLRKEPGRRPQELKPYLSEFVRILERVYGKPKYHQFTIS